MSWLIGQRIEEASMTKLFPTLRYAGATIVTAPYDTPYGSRELSCKDFEGHVWPFGTYAGEPLA